MFREMYRIMQFRLRIQPYFCSVCQYHSIFSAPWSNQTVIFSGCFFCMLFSVYQCIPFFFHCRISSQQGLFRFISQHHFFIGTQHQNGFFPSGLDISFHNIRLIFVLITTHKNITDSNHQYHQSSISGYPGP